MVFQGGIPIPGVIIWPNLFPKGGGNRTHCSFPSTALEWLLHYFGTFQR
jgi:hypothetical protein